MAANCCSSSDCEEILLEVNQNQIKEANDKNIVQMRIEYNKIVLNNLKLNNVKNIWSRKVVKKILKRIIAGESEGIEYEDDYEIMKVDGVPRLMMRSVTNPYKLSRDIVPLREIVPLEDTFQVIWEAHKKMDHPDHNSLVQYLRANYVINKDAIINIKNMCYVCKSKGILHAQCGLFLVDMNDRTDGQFTSILVYENFDSGYVHLRPIRSQSCDMDVALELMKIFMEFGPPGIVEYYDPIFKIALEYVKKILPFDLSIEIRELPFDFKRMNAIKKAILDWQQMASTSKSNSWGFGCFVIQWEINNRLIKRVDGPKFTSWDAVYKRNLSNNTIKPSTSKGSASASSTTNSELESAKLSDTTNVLHTEEDLGVLACIKEEPFEINETALEEPVLGSNTMVMLPNVPESDTYSEIPVTNVKTFTEHPQNLMEDENLPSCSTKDAQETEMQVDAILSNLDAFNPINENAVPSLQAFPKPIQYNDLAILNKYIQNIKGDDITEVEIKHEDLTGEEEEVCEGEIMN